MFAVIVENDKSIWDDKPGQAYHFPKRYAKFIPPGTKVIYYKGKLTDRRYAAQRLSKDPHYFGIATIGRHTRDAASAKNDLYAEVNDFLPFRAPISIRDAAGQYYEAIPDSRTSNYWRDGVRPLSEAEYDRILLAAELQTPPSSSVAKNAPLTASRAVPAISSSASYFSPQPGRNGRRGMEASIAHMAEQAKQTAAGSNGQVVERVLKNKEVRFSEPELKEYIRDLIAKQKSLCAITALPLQFHGEETDSEMLCSLDRIDSNGHYERGNLQVVCRFINRWKNDDDLENFRRLIKQIRSAVLED